MGQLSLKLLILLLLVCSCATEQRALRRARKHWSAIQAELMRHPSIADSLNLIRRDTIYAHAIRDSAVVVNDSTVWGDDFFISVDSIAADVVAAPLHEKAKPVTRLQKKICPEIDKDSTYIIPVTYRATLKDVKYYIPVRIAAKVKDGRITLVVDGKDVKMPDPEVVRSIVFKPVKPVFYRDQWFWVAVMLLVMLLTTLWGLAVRSRK